MTQDLVLLHQMGKVGSTTVFRSLKTGLEGTHEVFHTHFLNEDRLNRHVRSLKKTGRKFPYHVFTSRKVLKALETQKDRKVKVITLTREPIARNISAYFQNYPFTGSEDVDDLLGSFIENYPHELPLTWLDLEIRDVFGLDVYTEPFDMAKGYSIIESQDNHVSLMVIRMETLSSVLKNNTIEDFLGVPKIDFGRSSNVGDAKSYAPMYRMFKERIRFDQEHLDMMYSSKYCRHFYSSADIRGFRKRWTHDPGLFGRMRTLRDPR